MLKCCIIGAGFAARLHAQAYAGRAALCGVCASDISHARALADEYGCTAFSDAAAMLDAARPDIVSICAPTDLHAELVRLAASRGCHVLCEKPLALTDADCALIKSAAEEYGVTVMTAQVLRWWPEYRAARDIICSGRIGALRRLNASRMLCGKRGGWFGDPARSGGALFDLMAHDADYALWTLGDDIEAVYAAGRQIESGAWVYASALLKYRNGATARLEAGSDRPDGFPFTTLMQATGERGFVEASATAERNIAAGVKTDTKLRLVENGSFSQLPVSSESAQERAFAGEVAAFVSALENDGESPIPLDESIKVIRLLNIIKESLESGRVIDGVYERLNA